MEISLNNLSSRLVRRQVTGNSGGIRRFAVSGTGQLTQDNGNVITGALSAIFKFGGFLIGGALKFIFKGGVFLWSVLWGLFLRAKNFIWNFNWNTSDQELDKTLQDKINAFGGVLGSTIGTTVGQLLGGVLPGLLLLKFNVPLAVYVLKESGPEVLEEICASAGVLIQSLVSLAAQSLFTFLYKNIRRKITGGVREKDEALLKQMVKAGRITEERANQIREKRDAPWSFAIAQEKFVESLPTQFRKNLAENALEEGGENFDEASMLFANTVDEYFAMQQLVDANPLGQERTVEILLNRSIDDNAIPT
jgi:hypothetical protein